MPNFKRLRRILTPHATETNPSTALTQLAQPPTVSEEAFLSSYIHLTDLRPGEYRPLALYTHTHSDQSIVVKHVKAVHPQKPREFLLLDSCKKAGNIVTVLGLCGGYPDPGTDAILLEYCYHGDLLDYSNEFAEMAVHPSEKSLRNILKGLLQALVFLHDGIGSGVDSNTWKTVVHRDIKLENVLISKLDQETVTKDILIIKLTGFDLATTYDPNDCTMAHGQGSPVTWPPEQTLSECQATPAGDVWAAAAIMHALALSQYPLEGVDGHKAEYLREHGGQYPPEITSKDRDTLRERWFWEALAPRKVKALLNAKDAYDASGARLDRTRSGWQEEMMETRPVYSEQLSDLVSSALERVPDRKTALELLGEFSNMLNY